jgi:hypothetical protein
MEELGGCHNSIKKLVNWFLLYCVANSDKSNLYLKMFKLVFGSVTLFAQENELMLKVWYDL